MESDIRWQQRFSNYQKALQKLSEAVGYVENSLDTESHLTKEEDSIVDEIVREGIIQRFEYTHELAWNVMKDYEDYQGNSLIGGSRDATREAFHINLITEGNVWMDMIASRNKTSHTYNEQTASEIFQKIQFEYYPAFIAFEKVMLFKLEEEKNNTL